MSLRNLYINIHLILQRLSRYLWHSSKWCCQFRCVFQYTSGFEVLAYSINTKFNCEIQPISILNHKVAAICTGRIGLPNQFSSGILKDSNIIFWSKFKPIFSQSRGILEPTNSPRSPSSISVHSQFQLSIQISLISSTENSHLQDTKNIF